MTFCQAAAPATMNDTDSNGGSGLTALGNDTKSIGRLWVDTDTAIMYYWTGTAWVALAGTDPIGTVKFFHGAWSDNVTIPGWYECTAANAAAQGTVNGAGRILMGVALATYTDESTGGAVTATLATANLASHTHTGPSHTHAGNDLTVSNGTHTHTAAVQMDYVPIQEGTGADHVVLLGGNTTGTLGSVYHFVMADGSGAHTNHAVSGTTTAGGTGATGSSGSATAFSILNPYLVLHMIERRS